MMRHFDLKKSSTAFQKLIVALYWTNETKRETETNKRQKTRREKSG